MLIFSRHNYNLNSDTNDLLLNLHMFAYIKYNMHIIAYFICKHEKCIFYGIQKNT